MLKIFQALLDRIAPPICRYDPHRLHPDCIDAINLGRAREWDALDNLVGNRSDDDRSLLIEAVSDAVDGDDFFDDWVGRNRGNSHAHLFRGALLLKRAWHYRGWGRGSELDDESVIAFQNALEDSFTSLTEASNLRPEDKEAPARTIRVLMGLSAEMADIDIAHRKLRGDGPPHLLGEMNYLIANCEKWLGSHATMFGFARDRASTAGLSPLVAAAHYEYYMYLERFLDNPAEADDYISCNDVVDEITAARNAFIEHDVSSGLNRYLGHSIFALSFVLAKRRDLAKEHFERLHGVRTRYPWEHYEDEFFRIEMQKSLET